MLKYILEKSNRLQDGLKNRYGQMYALTQHFIKQLFHSSLVKSEQVDTSRLGTAMVLFVLAGGLIAHSVMKKHLLGAVPFDPAMLWVEKFILIAFIMSMSGILCAATWDNQPLSKEDFNALLPLPLTLRRIYFAKALSSLLFVLFITVLFNFFSSIIFAGYLWGKAGPGFIHRGSTFFGISFLGNLLVFLFLSSVRTVLHLLFPGRRARNWGVYLQVLFITGFTAVLIKLPDYVNLLPDWREAADPVMGYLPPMWFTALHEKLAGGAAEDLTGFIRTGWVVLGVSAAIYLLGFPLNYLRFKRVSGTVKPGFLGRNILAPAGEVFNRLVLRHPVELGVFHFVFKTIKRQLRPKIQVGLMMAIPLAFLVAKLSHQHYTRGLGYFLEFRAEMVSLPLVLFFFMIAAVKKTTEEPLLPGASWVIRLTESRDKVHYLSGLKKAVFIYGIIPQGVGLFFFYLYFWGLVPALYQTFFGFTVGVLLLEVFFWDYKRMPFVTVSGEKVVNVKRIVVLLVGFTLYLGQLTILGVYLLKHPLGYVYFYAVSGILYLLSKRYRDKRTGEFPFIYEEKDPEVFLSLGFDGN